MHKIPIISLHTDAMILFGRVLPIAPENQVVETELLLHYGQMLQLKPLNSISGLTIFFNSSSFRTWHLDLHTLFRRLRMYLTPCSAEKLTDAQDLQRVLTMKFAWNVPFPDDLEQDQEILWIVKMVEHWKLTHWREQFCFVMHNCMQIFTIYTSYYL